MTESFVVAPDGVRLALDVAGPADAPPVVLLHGIALDRTVWRPLLARAPALGLRFVAVDLRGHGASDKPTDPTAYAGRLGDDLAAVLAGLDRPVLVPWSYGGVVVGEWLRRPGARSPLGGILCAAAAVVMGRSAREYYGPGMMDHARGLMSDDAELYRSTCEGFAGSLTAAPHPELLEAGRGAAPKASVVARRAMLRRDEDFVADYSAAGCPISLIHGALDQVVRLALSETLARAIPGATLTVVPDVGHATFVEAPLAFERALTALVAAR